MRHTDITIGTKYHARLGKKGTTIEITIDRIEAKPAWFTERARWHDQPRREFRNGVTTLTFAGSDRWAGAFGEATTVGKLPDKYMAVGHDDLGRVYAVGTRYVEQTVADRAEQHARSAAAAAARTEQRARAWDEYDYTVKRITDALGIAPDAPTFRNWSRDDRLDNDPPATVTFNAEVLLGTLTFTTNQEATNG